MHWLKLFEFTTAGEWDLVAAVKNVSLLFIIVYIFICPLGSCIPLWNFEVILEGHCQSAEAKLAKTS